MADEIKTIVEQLTSPPCKECLPEPDPKLATKKKILLLEEQWQILIRGVSGTRRIPMISMGEASWLVQLAGGEHADTTFLCHFESKRQADDIHFSTETLAKHFKAYLDHFTAPNQPEPAEVTTLTTMIGTPQYLKVIVPQMQLDDRVKKALEEIVEKYKNKLPQSTKGLSSYARYLVKITPRFSSASMPDRLLLSKPSVYAYLISQQLFEIDNKGNFTELNGQLVPSSKGEELLKDPTGFAYEITTSLSEVRKAFVKTIIEDVKDSNKLAISATELELLIKKIDADGLHLSPNATEQQVLAARKNIAEEGAINDYISAYVARDQIKQEKFTYDIRRRMANHLLASGVNIKDIQNVRDGAYDEHFVLAYNQAATTADSTMYGSPTAGGWDFSVDTFDEVVDQAIIKENILAAGFLDYAYELGEKAHIFQLMDVLYLNWNHGILDLPQSQVTDTIERLWQERERRNTPEERGLSYKKALGKGDVQVMDRMIVNNQFENLWSTLMEEVANYIRKSEEISVIGEGAAPVSRVPIYQATRELQYNLTEYGNGRTKTQAAQLRSLLDTCFSVLDSPEIIDFYGFGTRRDRWTVIDRLHKEPPFESVPNLSALKTLAGKGNKVFQWIANFNEATVSDEEVETLVRSAEAWIIARGAAPEEGGGAYEDDDSLNDFEKDEEFDDFED